jgi:hypothetical protein
VREIQSPRRTQDLWTEGRPSSKAAECAKGFARLAVTMQLISFP